MLSDQMWGKNNVFTGPRFVRDFRLELFILELLCLLARAFAKETNKVEWSLG